MIKKHWTPNYITARVKQGWFERRNPDKPWFTNFAIEVLEQLLQTEDRVLEFGSGRSTIWFAKRCSHVLSIEHEEKWFESVSTQLDGFENVEYKLKTSNSGSSGLSDYVKVSSSLQNGSFTVIVNDGKERGLVAKHSLKKVAAGGIIVIDNAERYLPNHFSVPASRGLAVPDEDWEYFNEATRGWRRIWTSNGVTTTLLLFKPC